MYKKQIGQQILFLLSIIFMFRYVAANTVRRYN